MIETWRNAPDSRVLSERLAEIERRLDQIPTPAVGDWRLEQDSSGNLVAVNLRNRQYYVLVNATTAGIPF